MPQLGAVTSLLAADALPALSVGVSYDTALTTTENPLREGTAWDGPPTGWTNVRVTGGNAIGTQVPDGDFDDSIARKTGTWPANQRIEGVAYRGAGTISEFTEIELHVRMNFPTSSQCSTYEMNINWDGGYCDFIRWDGPLGTDIGDFVFIRPSGSFGLDGPVQNGDQFALQIVGSSLNGYVKRVGETLWTQINTLSVTDSTYATGNPGIGFYTSDGAVGRDLFGWQSLTMFGL